MNEELLRECFNRLRKDAAAGIDKMTKDNLAGIKRFAREAEKLLYKWLNRRGKRQSLSWEKFYEMLKHFPLPEPRIKVSMFGKSVN